MQKLRVGEVRLNWVALDAPQKNDQGEEVYNAQLLVPKDNKQLVDSILAAIEAERVTRPELKGWKVAKYLHDGDIEKDDDCYKGHFYVNVKSKFKPQLVQRVNGAIVSCADGDVYSGCYGYAMLSFFAYVNSSNKGVSALINSFFKTRDGNKLGMAASDPNADFGDLGETDINTDMPADLLL